MDNRHLKKKFCEIAERDLQGGGEKGRKESNWR